MTDQQPEEDAMTREFWSNPPPPDGVIPQGVGAFEYKYFEDGEWIHGVAHGVRTHTSQEDQ